MNSSDAQSNDGVDLDMHDYDMTSVLSLEREMDIQLRLLDVYTILSSSSQLSKGESNDDKEEAIRELSQQNSMRGEAVCWLRRREPKNGDDDLGEFESGSNLSFSIFRALHLIEEGVTSSSDKRDPPLPLPQPKASLVAALTNIQKTFTINQSIEISPHTLTSVPISVQSVVG
jgi:hypothetical protein